MAAVTVVVKEPESMQLRPLIHGELEQRLHSRIAFACLSSSLIDVITTLYHNSTISPWLIPRPTQAASEGTDTDESCGKFLLVAPLSVIALSMSVPGGLTIYELRWTLQT